MTAGPADAAALIHTYFAPDPPSTLGVAVSGGSDSTALLVLLADWPGGPEIRAVTVNHGLRAEAAAEAAQVAELCARLGVAHEVLRWEGWDGTGNLMRAAREARYALMAEWARDNGLRDVALGHTRDDLAENFLMRLARGAGLDGLAAMEPELARDGVIFHRPLLGAGRAELREILAARDIAWCDDPTNDDTRFERARARAALEALSPLGLTPETLAQTALSLRDARRALAAEAEAVAREIVRFEGGDVLIARAVFATLGADTQRRLLRAALCFVSGQGYGPRGRAMSRMVEAALEGAEMSLHGCRLLQRRGDLRVVREWQAVATLRGVPGAPWDARWQFDGPEMDGAHVAALGEPGLALCPDRKASGLPGASLMASPALWQGAQLVAAPLAGLEAGWMLRDLRPQERFFDALR